MKTMLFAAAAATALALAGPAAAQNNDFYGGAPEVPGFEPAVLPAHPPEGASDEQTDLSASPVIDPHGGIKGRRKSKKDKLREAALSPPLAQPR